MSDTQPVMIDPVEAERQRQINEQAQMDAMEFADGLHWEDYYRASGTGEAEVDAVIKRFQAIPVTKWRLAYNETDMDHDKQMTFARLRSIAPPAFDYSENTAVKKEAMDSDAKKTYNRKIREYKTQRKEWEHSDSAKQWKAEVKRLKEMEQSEYKPFEGVHMDPSMAGKVNLDRDILKYERNDGNDLTIRAGAENLSDELYRVFADPKYVQSANSSPLQMDIQNNTGLHISGLRYNRIIIELQRSLGDGMTNDEIISLYKKIMAPHKVAAKNDGPEKDSAEAEFDEGMLELKEIYFRQLKRVEMTYGTLITDMHPDDFLRQASPEVKDHFQLMQDCTQFMDSAAKYFDFTKDKDREYKRLADYYHKAWAEMQAYLLAETVRESNASSTDRKFVADQEKYLSEDLETRTGFAERLSSGVGGPHMGKRQKGRYNKDLLSRFRKRGMVNKLYGKFKPAPAETKQKGKTQ